MFFRVGHATLAGTHSWFLTSKINAVLMILVEVSVSIRERGIMREALFVGAA